LEGHRRVTEEDVHVTEALIADSFSRLKRSLAEAPHEAVRPATSLIREHPLAAAAAAAGTGVIAFQLIRMFAPGPSHREHDKKGGMATGLMGQLLSLAAPYIASMLQQQLGRALAGERR
jgi:hypothetical protein